MHEPHEHDHPRDGGADDTPLTFDRSARGLDTVSRGPLAHLSQLDDYRVAADAPDVRGWTLRTAIGRETIGEITDLLVDTGAMKVRYLEVKLDAKGAARRARADGGADPRVEPTRYALVPIGLAHVDDDHDEVLVEASALDLPGVPPYERGHLDRAFERAIVAGHRARGGGAARDASRSPGADDDDGDAFYDDAHFDDRRFLAARRSRGADAARLDAGEEIRVPVLAEQLVTRTRLVPTEEIVIRTRTVTEPHTVEGTVRRERVHVEHADAGRADAGRADAGRETR